MTKLDTAKETFVAVDGGSIKDFAYREKLLSNFMAPRKIELKIDAQVMLIKNVDDTLVNGTMGRVLRFTDPNKFGTEADEDLSGVVADSPGGQGSKKGPPSTASVGVKRYPVVEFVLPHAKTRRVLVMPEIWKVELPSGEVQVSRTQVSLLVFFCGSIIQYFS